MRKLPTIILMVFFLLFLVACDGGGSSEPLEYPEESSADDSSSSEGGLISSSSEGKSCSSFFDADTSSEETCIENECFLTDKRDGKTYRIVTIGDQTWMAENLKYEIADSLCRGNCSIYGKNMGRRYMWSAVMDSVGVFSTNGLGCGNGRMCSPDYPVRGICPAGWHLPCEAELESLVVVMHEKKAQGKEVWNEFAQSVSPFFTYADYWSSTEANDSNAYDLLVEETTFSFPNHYWPKNTMQSVRCIKGKNAEQNMDKWLSFSSISHSSSSVSSSSSSLSSSSSSLPESSSSIFVPPCKTETEDSCEYGTLFDDRDGQSYKTVKIGNQWWMAENLNFAYLQPTAELDSSSWCYDNDPENCKKYGRLYLWSAAIDSAALFNADAKGFGNGTDCGNLEHPVRCSPLLPVRGICPLGWHLPSREDWQKLSVRTGSSGDRLKSRTDWLDAYGGTDDYGFNVLPAGTSYNDDYSLTSCYNINKGAFYWTPEGTSPLAAWRALLYEKSPIGIDETFKEDALSVRCIKDSDE